MDDLSVVAAQLGRQPRAFRRVAARCPWGAPAVTEQDPYGADGVPFPTTYYLTCPHLVAAVSRLEAAGGVERWSERGRERPRAASATSSARRPSRRGSARGWPTDAPAATAATRSRWGIGGSRNPGQLKCLHAHVAFGLAVPGYELGDRILAEVAEPWPGTCCSLERGG